MSFDHHSPQLAIDHKRFSQALERDALDVCLDYLRRNQAPEPEAAKLISRLSEKLFRNGRTDDAVECGRLAFALAANDNEVADFCAWLFSNCGCYAEAVAAYERLIEHRPDWG